jgi:hypothetical protein
MCRLILKPSKIAGLGVFTMTPIKCGAKPPLFSRKERVKLVRPTDADFLTKRYCPYDKQMSGYWAPWNFNRMSIGWYLNHSPRPNIHPKTFAALRNIKRGEELTVDYEQL